jgi:ribulose-5-phosphate 4-epimerase/fuculose-1-phosphate aldolase
MFKDFQQLTIKIVNLVNSPRKTQRIIRNTTVPRMILKNFVEIIRLMETRQIFLGSLSEISIRTSGGKMLVTPKDLPTSRISEESLLSTAINPDTAVSIPDLPEHIDWHRLIYSKSEANAIVLCQPVFSCILAERMQTPNKTVLAEAGKIIDLVRCVKMEEVQLDQKVENECILLIRSIGVLAWGKELDSVLSRIETVERICEIEIRSGA